MAVFDALNFNNEVFRCYITWCSILILKVLLMGPLTGFQRFRKGVSKRRRFWGEHSVYGLNYLSGF